MDEEMKAKLEEMNEFADLMKDMDISSFSLMDQMYLGCAYMEFVEKVKPIYLKYAAKNSEITNFIFKL